MAVYVVANLDVTDPDVYQQYRAGVSETVVQHGGKFLAVDMEPQDLDGQSRAVLVIGEFESAEAVKRWYDSSEYQALLKFRLASTEGWLRLVPQVS